MNSDDLIETDTFLHYLNDKIIRSIKNYNMIENINKNNYVNNENSSIIAKQIKQVLNSGFDDNFNTLLLLYKKIITHQKIVKELLNYEFLFYEPDNKNLSIEELLNVIKKIFDRYQLYLSGNLLDDTDWIIQRESSKRFKLKQNQIILVNSMDLKYIYDTQTINYLNNLIIHLYKYVNKEHISIKYKLCDDDDNDICWIIFVLTDLQKT